MEHKAPLFEESEPASTDDSQDESIRNRAFVMTTCSAGALCGGCCCCILIVLVVGYFAAVNYLSGLAIKDFITIDDARVNEFCREGLTMSNITLNNYWPGCGFDKVMQACTEPCYEASIIEDMATFNMANGGQIVYYSSRNGTGENGKPIQDITLGGWWLPAPARFGDDTPRIVLQHGFTSNSNKHSPQIAAYMLRSIGFSVLMNNFRDHCYSGESIAHVYEWGHAYPYDVLGAWDYARNDPDGILGGTRPASKVGIVGYSKGAFVTSATFGMEARIPAVWVDAPPFTPKAVFTNGAKQELASMGIAFLDVGGILTNAAWANVEQAAMEKGVDLNEHLPADTLPNGPDTKRPIFWAGNTDDETVPIEEGETLVETLEKYPLKYNVSTWTSSGFCHGRAHHYDLFAQFDVYKSKLCDFWTDAFGLPASYCRL